MLSRGLPSIRNLYTPVLNSSSLRVLFRNWDLIFSIDQNSLLLMLSGIVTAQHFSSKTYSRYMVVLGQPTTSLLTVRKVCVRLLVFSDCHVCSISSMYCMFHQVSGSYIHV
jgi:hypothetical protein